MEIAVGTKPVLSQRGNAEAHVAEVLAPGIVLLAVAEGFGYVRGQSAPHVATTAVRDALRRRIRGDGKEPRAALMAAFSAANARIFAHSGSNDDFVASGTSLTAALIVGDRAHVAHVGRTRAYLGRDGSLSALTNDDELGGEGWSIPRAIVPTEALAGRLLTRTLGTQPTLEASITNVRLMHADSLVLATGGLHRALNDDEIAHTLRSADSSESATVRLLEIAKLRGASSGGTVIVGRALTEPASLYDVNERHVSVRTAAIALTTLVIASLIAMSIAHAFIAP